MRTALTLCFLCLAVASARANDASSAYTTFDVKHCKTLSPAKPSEEWGGSSLCKGLGNAQIYFAEGDLRTMVAFGIRPDTHCAATQTFGRFNTVNNKVEWRLRNGVAFATILRWSVSDAEDADKQKTWLVVTRLEARNSCRAAVVEGSLPDANARARDAADTIVPGFNCSKDEPKVISATPMKAEELMSGSPCSAQ